MTVRYRHGETLSPVSGTLMLLALPVVALLLQACGRTGIDEAAAPDTITRPNVILILVDALRRDHVGAYGYGRSTTPYLDELADRGVTLTNAYSQAPQTLTSTASLFTSRSFPYMLREVDHDPIPGLAEDRQELWAKTPRMAQANLTMAEALRDAGYQTLGLFDNPHHHPTSGFWQGFDDAQYLTGRRGLPYARADTVCRTLVEWVEGRDRARPFFAYVHLMDVHNPYSPPPSQRALFPPGEGRHLYVNGVPEEGFSDADLYAMQALYDAEIRFVDDTLNLTLSRLQAQGELEDTVIVVTSDHGDEFLDHGGLGHGMTVELELLRIPIVIAGAIPDTARGLRLEFLVRNLDLFPTILDIVGSPMPPDLEGTSLWPWIAGTSTMDPPQLTSYAWISQLRSVTTDRWHMMADRKEGTRRLYDIDTDPPGSADVLERHPETVRSFKDFLRNREIRRRESVERSRELREVETTEGSAAADAEVLEQLRELGYLGSDSGS